MTENSSAKSMVEGAPARAPRDCEAAPATERGRRARRFGRDAVVFAAAILDRRVPWRARLSAAAMPVAFYLTPFDPIPNRIPIAGHLDDMLVVLLAGAVFIWLIPAIVRKQLRAELQLPSAARATGVALTVAGLASLAAITALWCALLVWGAARLFAL